MRPPRSRAKHSQVRGAARARYALYMDSPAWWERRRQWLANYRQAHNGQNPTCVVCDKPWIGRHGDLHHRTYEHLGCERNDDLIPMCRSCHDRLHAVIDFSLSLRKLNRSGATDLSIKLLRERSKGKN